VLSLIVLPASQKKSLLAFSSTPIMPLVKLTLTCYADKISRDTLNPIVLGHRFVAKGFNIVVVLICS